MLTDFMVWGADRYMTFRPWDGLTTWKEYGV